MIEWIGRRIILSKIIEKKKYGPIEHKSIIFFLIGYNVYTSKI